ncbi:MAG: carboxypeptidase-like regulatory domain-containing protein, partial [Planctomycetota bacterium]
AHVAGDREKRMKWWNEWKQTPEGIIWSSTYAMFQEDRRKSPYMTATVNRDGTFRFDDVPPGEYVLRLRNDFEKKIPGQLELRVRILEDAEQSEIDLGTLQLTKER